MLDQQTPRLASWLNTAFGIALCLILGSLSGFIAGSGPSNWYNQLNQPVFTPPPWVFGPVWTVLYIMIGIAAAYLWQRKQSEQSLFRLFILQLVLNLIWSPVFFGLHSILSAAVIIVILWMTLIRLLYAAWSNHRLVTYLLLPYFVWVSFAMVLNISLVVLN